MDRGVRQISVITESEHPPVTTIDIDIPHCCSHLYCALVRSKDCCSESVRGGSIPCFGQISDYL